MVEQQTRRTARLYGFDDRGTIEVGQRADLNVIDLDNLTVRRPVMHADLPPAVSAPPTRLGLPGDGGGRRQTRADDQDTGERPGQLVRGAP